MRYGANNPEYEYSKETGKPAKDDNGYTSDFIEWLKNSFSRLTDTRDELIKTMHELTTEMEKTNILFEGHYPEVKSKYGKALDVLRHYIRMGQ